MHKTETRLNGENTMQEQTTADRFEAISALADGRLREPALAETLQWLDQDQAARQTWLAYHVIGDVLREPDLAEAAHDSTFVQRLRRRLPYESLSVGAQDAIELIASDAVVTSTNSRFDVKTEAANQPRFNWRRVSGVFSLLLLAGLGWALLGQRGNFGSGSAELAAASAVPAPTAVAQAGRARQRGCCAIRRSTRCWQHTGSKPALAHCRCQPAFCAAPPLTAASAEWVAR